VGPRGDDVRGARPGVLRQLLQHLLVAARGATDAESGHRTRLDVSTAPLQRELRAGLDEAEGAGERAAGTRVIAHPRAKGHAASQGGLAQCAAQALPSQRRVDGYVVVVASASRRITKLGEWD